MKPHGKMAAFLAMGAMFAAMGNPMDLPGPRRPRKPSEPKAPVTPAGVQEFHFDEYGEVLDFRDPRVFITVKAINLKNAKRKALKLLLP